MRDRLLHFDAPLCINLIPTRSLFKWKDYHALGKIAVISWIARRQRNGEIDAKQADILLRALGLVK